MTEYKYIIFFVGSIVCVPTGILLASSYRKIHDFVFIFLVFGTCMPASLFGLPTDINFLSREWYRGSTRGVEISYLDLLALILFISSIVVRRKEGRAFFWPPSLGLLLSYFTWCFMSVVLFSDPKLFGLFELTKIARAILLFVAVAAYIRSPREIHVFVWALVVTTFYEAVICLRDRYLYGIHRIRGTLGHPNSLSMYCLQSLPIFIAVFFASNVPKRLRKACIIAFMAAFGCVILTISRTGFAALIILSVASFAFCSGFQLKAKNIALFTFGIIVMSMMVVKSYDNIMSRLGGFDFEREYLSESGDRGSYFRRAMPAIQDKPITGVGLNNWSYWITNRYSAEAGYFETGNFLPLIPIQNTTSHPNFGVGTLAPAHNLYLLTLTELGWPGLFLLITLFIYWALMGRQVLFGKHKRFLESVLLGSVLSLFGVLMQSWTEWEFRQTSLFFLGHIIMAVAASLYYHQGKGRTV